MSIRAFSLHSSLHPAAEAPLEECEGSQAAGGCVQDWLAMGNDGLSSFSWDHPSPVRKQLMETDPGLNQGLISSAMTITQLFNQVSESGFQALKVTLIYYLQLQDLWERHRSPNRYATNLKNILNSTVLRRILQPMIGLVLLSILITAYNISTPPHWIKLASSLVPHTLLGAALSLLLVFRTNGCFARFNEGRALWGQLIKCSRDWMRLASNYFPPHLKKKASRYVQCYAFCLKSSLRSGRTRNDPSDPTAYRDDPSVIVNSLLPDPGDFINP